MARHNERHYTHRTGWIRASVLGANDGIISTAALILGVAAADSTRTAVLTAGVAGLAAGALSMGLGEFVSVSSQRDTEEADIAKEVWELENTPERELAELTAIYQEKGLKHDLAAVDKAFCRHRRFIGSWHPHLKHVGFRNTMNSERVLGTFDESVRNVVVPAPADEPDANAGTIDVARKRVRSAEV